MDGFKSHHTFHRFAKITRRPVERVDGVYRRRLRCVKPLSRVMWLIPVRVAAIVAVGLATAGCATRPSFQSSAASRAHLVLAAYDVEPMFVSHGDPAAIEAIRRDFQEIANLGLDGVLLRHVDDADQKTVAAVAHENGLDVAFTSQRLQHLLRTGVLPSGCKSRSELVRAVGIEPDSGGNRAVIALECGTASGQLDQCIALRDAIDQTGSRSVVVVPRDAHSTLASLAVIDVAVGATDRRESPLETWLAQYHQRLSAGDTSGVVFYRYRRIPGDGPGLKSADESPRPARTAAVKELITRASLWGPRLIGADAAPMSGPIVANDNLSFTAFIRGQRRYVLLVNRSLERYHRGRVVLPETVGSIAVKRAVEVPASKAKPAGRVFETKHGRVELSVALRPGDAALFEIF